ncbi:MAG TPA: hypothetical protein VGD52_20505 [Pseudoduganella sp.]
MEIVLFYKATNKHLKSAGATAPPVLLAAAPAFAIDQTVRPVDPSNFDVAGVRLGMASPVWRVA